MASAKDLEDEKLRIKKYFDDISDEEFEDVLKRNGMKSVKSMKECGVQLHTEEVK